MAQQVKEEKHSLKIKRLAHQCETETELLPWLQPHDPRAWASEARTLVTTLSEAPLKRSLTLDIDCSGCAEAVDEETLRKCFRNRLTAEGFELPAQKRTKKLAVKDDDEEIDAGADAKQVRRR
eukprot:313630-Amphidinium_carterae.1